MSCLVSVSTGKHIVPQIDQNQNEINTDETYLNHVAKCSQSLLATNCLRFNSYVATDAHPHCSKWVVGWSPNFYLKINTQTHCSFTSSSPSPIYPLNLSLFLPLSRSTEFMLLSQAKTNPVDSSKDFLLLPSNCCHWCRVLTGWHGMTPQTISFQQRTDTLSWNNILNVVWHFHTSRLSPDPFCAYFRNLESYIVS